MRRAKRSRPVSDIRLAVGAKGNRTLDLSYVVGWQMP
jgi:hypothetical protein